VAAAAGPGVAALVGSPVAHSLSPAIHRAAFAAAGVDWSYVAFDVASGRGAAAVAAVRTLGLRGLSVTTPLKEEAAAAVDALSPAAVAMGAANTVVVDRDGRLRGESTDGDGFVASLTADGVDPVGRRFAVLGAGGAARSVVEALGRAGAVDIVVVNRSPARAEAAAALAATARPATGDVGGELAAADVIVNATTVGFAGGDEPDGVPFDVAVLHPGHVVCDLVYHPMETPLLRAARGAGARAVDGLGMLVHQAALQQQLWLGHLPDVAVMRAAAEAELTRRRATP